MTSQIPTSNPYPWPHDSTLSPTTTALLIIDMQRDFLSPGGYLSTQGYSLTSFQALIPPLVSLLSTFRRAGFPIYHTREGHAAHMGTVSGRERFRSRWNGGGGRGAGEEWERNGNGNVNGNAAIGIGAPGPLGRYLIIGERGHDIVSALTPLPSEPVIDKPGRSAFCHTSLELQLRSRGIRNLVICGVTAEACVSSTVRDASDRGFDCLVVEDGIEGTSEELKKWTLESIRVEGGLFGVTGWKRDVVEAVETWMKIERSESSQY